MKPISQRFLLHTCRYSSLFNTLRSPFLFGKRQYSSFDLSTDQDINFQPTEHENFDNQNLDKFERLSATQEELDSITTMDESDTQEADLIPNYEPIPDKNSRKYPSGSEETKLRRLYQMQRYDIIMKIFFNTKHKSPALRRFALISTPYSHSEAQLPLLIQICKHNSPLTEHDIQTITKILFKYRHLESFMIPLIMLISKNNLPGFINSFTESVLHRLTFVKEKLVQQLDIFEQVFSSYFSNELKAKVAHHKATCLLSLGLWERVPEVIAGYENTTAIKKLLASRDRILQEKDDLLKVLQKSDAKMDRHFADLFSKLEKLLLVSDLDVSEQVFKIVKKKKYSYAASIILIYMQQLLLANRASEAFELLPIYHAQENKRTENIFYIILQRLYANAVLQKNKNLETYQKTREVMIQVIEYAKTDPTSLPTYNYTKFLNELAVAHQQWKDIQVNSNFFERSRTILDEIFKAHFRNNKKIILQMVEPNMEYFLHTHDSGDFNSYFNVLLQTYLELGQYDKAGKLYEEYLSKRGAEFDFVTLSTINQVKKLWIKPKHTEEKSE